MCLAFELAAFQHFSFQHFFPLSRPAEKLKCSKLTADGAGAILIRMNRNIPIGQAKPKLGELVESARQGQTHVITVHDQPCAQIGPVKSQAQKLTDEWRERRKQIRLNRPGQKRLRIAELIQECRK